MSLLTFSYIEPKVPVRFNSTTYTVNEAKNVTITLEVLAEHSFPFKVRVSSQDGTANGECYGE